MPDHVSRHFNPYPPHYRLAFAFSIFLYPHHFRPSLRLAFLFPGVIRAYHVPLDNLDGVGLTLSTGGSPSAVSEFLSLTPVHFPFGPSLSAGLASSP